MIISPCKKLKNITSIGRFMKKEALAAFSRKSSFVKSDYLIRFFNIISLYI